MLKGALTHVRDPAAAAAASNMELRSSFYAKLDEVKVYHSLNVVEGNRAGGTELLPLLFLG